MKAKLNNERLIKSAQLLSQVSQKQLPIKASYAISKNIAHIESELKIYNNEKSKIVDKYCEKNKDGQPKIENGNYVIKKDCREAWNKDIKELNSIENEIDIHTFKIEDLGNVYFSPAEFGAIDYMIAEEKK